MSNIENASPQGDADDNSLKTSTYKVPRADYREIKAMAARNDMSVQSVVNVALQEYCERRGITLPSLK